MFKILIADDETKIRETIKDYFSAKDFDVVLAANGKEAVELSILNSFDLIILDVMMPVMDGLSACKEIRKTNSIPVLFLSALGEEHDFLNGYSSGADDYIVKPFPLSVLHEKCLAMIKRYKGIHNENIISVYFIIFYLIAIISLTIYFKKRKKLEDVKKAFTGAAAHELKTPLSVIENQCEYIMENVLPRKTQNISIPFTLKH